MGCSVVSSVGEPPRGDGYRGDVAEHRANDALFAAWHADGHERRVTLLRPVPPPGPIALRSRYRHLLDPETPAGPLDPTVSRAAWDATVRLETSLDDAIRRNDPGAAAAICARLLDAEPSPGCRLVSVHARIGLGDAAMAADEVDRAMAEYEEAVRLATADGYRFGLLRALVPLAYLTLRYHSARAAAELFTSAGILGRALDDPVYTGNALLGRAECVESLEGPAAAVEFATEAYEVFSSVRSTMGQGNSAQRLGAMLHRLDRPAEATEWLTRAGKAFEENGNKVGLANVLSCLGDIALEQRDFVTAERWYLAGRDAAAGLPRSAAHAKYDFARVARGRGDWPEAVRRFEVALAAYQELDELTGACHALDKLAEAHAALGAGGEVVSARLAAMVAVERYRATHRDERSQREYRERFAAVYSHALAAVTEYGSAGGFAVVADSLAGRRLAGLIEASVTPSDPELTLLQELLVRSDQRLLSQDRSSAAGPSEPGELREQRIRLLGAFGIRHGLGPRAEASLDDMLAAVYLPPPEEGAELLDALPADCDVLVTLLDPAEPDRLYRLWRTARGPVELGSIRLDPALLAVLEILTGDDDARAQLHLDHLEPAVALIPEPLRRALSAGTGRRLLIVPVGALWLIPWSAVPVDAQHVLGEVAPYVVCPSLTVHRQLAARAARVGPPPWSVDIWRSPAIRHHPLTAFGQDARWQPRLLETAREARATLRGGRTAMAVAGHGRPAPGLGHYLELDRDEWLLPVDLVGATPPRRLFMVACWGGAVPGAAPNDPISLATLALAGGSSEVLATVGELADSELATEYLEHLLGMVADTSLPTALHAATARLLAEPADRAEPILHWAPLIPLGTFLPDGA